MEIEDLYQNIKNRTSRADVYVTNSCNRVACYHSARSKFLRQQDWFMRLYLHGKINPNQLPYLITFTYNPDCCPVYDTISKFVRRGYYPQDTEVSKHTIPVFSRSDAQKFFKKLRKRLKNAEIKYLWCSEFGKRFTRRPHYHAIVFCSDSVSPSEFISAVRSSWSYVVPGPIVNGLKTYNSVPLGNVFVSEKNADPVVHNTEGLRYASKYITKDDYLDDDNRFNSLSDEEKKFLKPYMPFKLSSTNLGVHFEKAFDVHDALFNGIPVETLDYKSGNRIIKRYRLPYVCIDKYFYAHKYEKVQKYTDIMDDITFVETYRHIISRVVSPGKRRYILSSLSRVLSLPFDVRIFKKHILVVSSEMLAKGYFDGTTIVHTRSLIPSRAQLYYSYTIRCLRDTAIKYAPLVSKSVDDVYKLLLYSKLEYMIIPSNEFLFYDNYVPSISDLEDILAWRYGLSPSDLPYRFGYDGVKPLLQHNHVFCQRKFCSVLSDELNKLYEFMLNRSNSLIQKMRDEELRCKLAVQKHRGF